MFLRMLIIIFVLLRSIESFSQVNRHLFMNGKEYWRIMIYPNEEKILKYPQINFYDSKELKGTPVATLDDKGFTYKSELLCKYGYARGNRSVKKDSPLYYKFKDTLVPYKKTYFYDYEEGVFFRKFIPDDLKGKVDYSYLPRGYLGFREDPTNGVFSTMLECENIVDILNEPVCCGGKKLGHYELLLTEFDGKIGTFEWNHGKMYAFVKSIAELPNATVYPKDEVLYSKFKSELKDAKQAIEEIRKCFAEFKNISKCEKVGLGKDSKMRKYFLEHMNYKELMDLDFIKKCYEEIEDCTNETARKEYKVKGIEIGKCGNFKQLGINVQGMYLKDFYSKYDWQRGLCTKKWITKTKNLLKKSQNPEKKKLNPNLKKKVIDLLDLKSGRFHFYQSAFDLKTEPTKKIDKKLFVPNSEYCLTHYSDDPRMLYYTGPRCGPNDKNSLNVKICFKIENDKKISTRFVTSCIDSPSFFIDQFSQDEFKRDFKNYVIPRYSDF